MAERLTELYAVGTAVQIWLGEQVWVDGTVVAHQSPAVWVRTVDGRSWFVTNRRRIRLEEWDADERG
ncbi:MAG: hypothetical protein H6654_13560 [Ardenticatenaceae bacterium]|nr:hypothetical protein [Anaerolineales bacterium]MCB8941525.1 hypothetical protein [Ardenticatenaceae bacterium]MCB8974581.1 hypothetical protein [Ardenticatenaceae bacterium]